MIYEGCIEKYHNIPQFPFTPVTLPQRVSSGACVINTVTCALRSGGRTCHGRRSITLADLQWYASHSTAEPVFIYESFIYLELRLMAVVYTQPLF